MVERFLQFVRNRSLAISIIALLAAGLLIWVFLPADVREKEVADVKVPNISATQPELDAEVGLPLIVKGRARTFENTVNIRLLNAAGQLLVEGFATAQSPDIGLFGPFEAELYYPEPETAAGTVEVFQYSARDGSEIDKVTIPVTFKADIATTSVLVFFGSRTQDPEGLQCGTVYPVSRRIPETQAVGRAALEFLLTGPYVNEMREGYFTSINSGVRIQSLEIADGTARLDFSSMLEEGVGGSCRVTAINAQITETLRQFPTVDDVVISIDGRTDDILQP